MGKNRLEAFSDGVIAIIITIMLLEMKVPHGEGIETLVPLIPVFLSYVLSFVYLRLDGVRSCNDAQVFRGAWDQTFISGLPGLVPLPQDSLSTCLSINNSGLSIDLLIMSLQQPASGRSPDPWPRAGTSRRVGGRLSNN